MEDPSESSPLPKVGDTIRLDITNTTLKAMLGALAEDGQTFDFGQNFHVKEVSPEGISLVAEDEDFEVTIPFECYTRARLSLH